MFRMLLAFAVLAVASFAPARVKESPAPGAPDSATVAPEAPAAAPAPRADGGKTRVVVIPVRDQIADPILYILRRGLKSAGKDDWVILDMKTPGGRVDTALAMMEALDKFEGRTATYVNDEAVSAGAFIASVTQEIYFAPKGVIGAAAAVSSEGADIPETMRLKINSYLKAKVRAYSQDRGFRSQVIAAMMDKDFELKIGETLIKPKGELLSLTDTEAAKTYGNPPKTLLSAGTFKSIEALLDRKLGAGNYVIEKLEVTWSEDLAQWLTRLAPLFLGLGLLCLFIEFKLGSFGLFGVVGGALLLLVFFGSYVTGLSGHEPVVFFALGLLMVLVEIFFFPGVVAVALTGLVLMLGSLLWAMADIWPSQPVTFSGDLFVRPLVNLGIGVLVAGGFGLALARFLPRRVLFQRLVVSEAATAAAQVAGVAPEVAAGFAALLGAEGIAATGLFPGGQVEIDGRRFEARVEVGAVPAGTPVRVVQVSDFGLIVEPLST